MTELHVGASPGYRAATPFEPRAVRGGRSPLLRAYTILVYVVGIAILVRASGLPLATAAGAVLICAAGLAPGYYWCAGRSPGLPIFPLFALAMVWTFGLPLLNDHPLVMRYAPHELLTAALTVAGFLVLATVVWLRLGAPRPHGPRRMYVLDAGWALPCLTAVLGLDALFQAGTEAGWLWAWIDPGMLTSIRGALLGLSTVAAFVVPYLWSRGRVKGVAAGAAFALLVIDGICSMSALMLALVLFKSALSMIGMILGGRRLRLMPLVVVLCLLIPLHYGKSSMRARYWAMTSDRSGIAVTPWQYPQFFAEWYGYSIAQLTSGDSDDGPQRVESFATRSSLMQLFLRARQMQRRGTQPLRGETYAIIPTLLVPRILAPDKPASHEGTTMLNVRYGLQRREDAISTTIGWGLFNEAFGNFGYAGVVGLALVLGSLLGAYARWTQDAPELSVRYLVSVIVLGMSIQTELSAGVLSAELLQSGAALAMAAGVMGARRMIVRSDARAREGRDVAPDDVAPNDVAPGDVAPAPGTGRRRDTMPAISLRHVP